MFFFIVGLDFPRTQRVYAGEPQVLHPSPVLMTVVGSFYTDVETSPTSIESIHSWGPYLYLVVRYVNGDQKLEVWDVRQPGEPTKIQSLDYGNLLANPQAHYRLPYVNVFDDAIIVRSKGLDYIFRPGDTGELIQVAVNDFAGGVAEILNPEATFPMSSAASYGTYFGQLYEPYQVLPEEEYGYRILNFTNPLRPFVSTTVPPKTVEELTSQFPGHINAALQNMPGRISVSDNRLSLSVRKIRSESFIDVFWEPRIPQIFNTETLDRTIRSQIDDIVTGSPLADRFAEAVERFFSALELGEGATIRSVIEAKYESDIMLKTVLEEFGISPDESARSAIRKIVSAQLDLDLEKQLSRSLFRPIFTDWTEDLFNIPVVDSTPDELKTTVSNIVNDGLSAETVARYLLDNYVAPLLEDTEAEWLFWTMDELVDEVVNSDLGEAVSVIIGGAHDVATGGGFLEEILDLVPEEDRFPSMPEFPEDCRDVLEYVLYDGAGLKRDGLAFMEMLKLYEYYSGNEVYLNYELDFSNAIRDLQIDLSGAFVETVEPFFAAYSYAGDMVERLSAFSDSVPSRDVICSAVVDAIIARLEFAGVDVDRTVHEVLLDYALYIELTDAVGISTDDLARMEDLLRVLENDLHASEMEIHALWDEGKERISYFESACRNSLAEMLREAWGDVDLDISLHSALREFLMNHVDSKWTFGDQMDELLQEFVNSTLTEYPGFADYISLGRRAWDGDGVAQWQITFKIAKGISALAEPSGSTTATCEAVEVALEQAFHQALAAAMRHLVYEYTMAMWNEMLGGHAAWVSRTQPINFTFDIDELTSLESVRTEAFVWENRIGMVAREDWDYINPRRVSLVLFNPNESVKTAREFIFDKPWGGIDYVHASDGVVLICGTQYDGIRPQTTAAFIALDDDNITLQTLHDYRLAAAEGITTVNHGAHLVVYGPGGVFLLTSPLTVRPPKSDGDTGLKKWIHY